MNIKFKSSYRKVFKNGTAGTVFVYQVTATAAELKKAKAAKQENIVEQPDGSVLLFTTRYAGASAVMIESPKTGKFNIDNSELDQIRSLVEQNPGALGNAIAESFAAKLVASRGVAASAPVAEPASLSK
jgi:hypothetical protein